MKRAYLGVLLGLVLAASSSYARPQTLPNRNRDDSNRDRDSRTFDRDNGPVMQPSSRPAFVMPPTTMKVPPTTMKVPPQTIDRTRGNFVTQRPVVNRAPDFRHHDHDFDHDRDRGHDFHHRRPIHTFVFVYGVPYYYVTAPYYDADDSPAYVYSDSSAQGYYQPGYDWGVGLRNRQFAWDDFIGYMRQYILVAAPDSQMAFRDGFIGGYGVGGSDAYDQAAVQVTQQASAY